MKSARELLQVDSEGIVTAPYILVYASGNRRHIRPLGDLNADVLCGVQKGLHGDTSIFNEEDICPKCLRELAKRPKAPEPHRAIVDNKTMVDEPTESDEDDEGPVRMYEMNLACGRFEAVREDFGRIVIYDENGDEFLRMPRDVPRKVVEFFIPALKAAYNDGVKVGKALRSAAIRRLLEDN